MPHQKFFMRKSPDLSHYIQASKDAAGGVHDPATGHFGELHHTGCESRERALEIKRALFRAAGYHKCSVAVRIVQDADGTHRVIFTAIDKEHARAYVKARYGDKPPYTPRKRT
jgi:hypothetical protein